MVEKVNDNATYLLRELDGTMLRIPVASKCMKVFRRRDERFLSCVLDSFLPPPAIEEDIEDQDEDPM